MAPLKPTPGEAMVLWRRRAGLNQYDAAKDLKVPVDRLRQWEADKHSTQPPPRNLGKLRDYEVCFILRRRAGLTQREVAVKIGCTRLWCLRMEEGAAPADRLKEYWKL